MKYCQECCSLIWHFHTSAHRNSIHAIMNFFIGFYWRSVGHNSRFFMWIFLKEVQEGEEIHYCTSYLLAIIQFTLECLQAGHQYVFSLLILCTATCIDRNLREWFISFGTPVSVMILSILEKEIFTAKCYQQYREITSSWLPYNYSVIS